MLRCFYHWFRLAPQRLFSNSALPILEAEVESKQQKFGFSDMTKKIAIQHSKRHIKISEPPSSCCQKVLQTFQNPTFLHSLETVCCRYLTSAELFRMKYWEPNCLMT